MAISQGCVASLQHYSVSRETKMNSIRNIEGFINNLMLTVDTAIKADSAENLRTVITNLNETCWTNCKETNTKKKQEAQ